METKMIISGAMIVGAFFFMVLAFMQNYEPYYEHFYIAILIMAILMPIAYGLKHS